MSTNSTQSFKDDLLSNALKCGSLILSAILLVGFLIVFSSEVGAAISISFQWTIETFILAKDGFYAAYAYWSWLPPVVTAVFIVAYLWLTCICASMKKKYLQSDLYYRLDTVRVMSMMLSIVGALLYAPVTKAPELVFLLGLFYAMVTLYARIIEMQNNERAERLLSQE